MNRQDQILRETARHHGITYSQAQEVWSLLGAKIQEVLNTSEVKTDGLYDIDKFPIIHIDSFGKFIPNKKGIIVTNTILKEQQK